MKAENEHPTSNVQHPTFNEEKEEYMPDERKYDLEERLLDFSAAIIELVDNIRPTQAGRHVAGQLLRSGTNPLGSHGEAQSAESTKDFVHKFKVGLKELRESLRWLKLIRRSRLHENPDAVVALLSETDELIRIFFKSVQTAQKRLGQES